VELELTVKVEVPVSVAINALAAKDGSSVGSGLSPETIRVSGMFVTVRVGAWQDVDVQVVNVVGGVPLDKLPHDVGGHGWGNPFSGVDTFVANKEAVKGIVNIMRFVLDHILRNNFLVLMN